MILKKFPCNKKIYCKVSYRINFGVKFNLIKLKTYKEIMIYKFQQLLKALKYLRDSFVIKKFKL